ncbi:hypothetical protein [Halopiger goleimassiliensis]|uniref:hypothetical protein n=1 Tax=Halopiger goleimassiliensis TaxID=1293048 RepID=UPI0009DBA0CA|nr:hypothetical protein [Halopiger goleimassiliensis]
MPDVVDGVYAGSNRRYYTGWQIDRRLERGRWRCCLEQREPDRLLIEVERALLLSLVRIDPSDLPPRVEIRIDGDRARIVEHGRPRPAPVALRREGRGRFVSDR